MTTGSTPTEPKPKRPRQPRQSRAKKKEGPSTPSPAQVLANQKNCLLAKGPITEQGKAISRSNAMKHGHCALVVDVPGEDPAMFQMRFDAWRDELNPAGSTHGDYLLSIAVRKSLDLDRLNVARTARLAECVRSARTDRTEARTSEVEGLLKRVQEDCGTASRQLRLTTEGCEAPIDEWERLKAPLLWPPHWDRKDAERIAHLQGKGRIARKESPHVMVIPTLWIERYRKVVEKLKADEFGEAYDSQYRYHRDADKERDRADLSDMEAGARHGVTRIRTVIEAEQRNLRERIEWLKESGSADESETMLRARLDPSEEGRLLRRYESEAERGLLKVMDVLRGGMKAWAKSMQVNEEESVAPNESDAVAPSGPAQESRNEADSGVVVAARTGVGVVEIEGVSVVQMTIGRATDPPDRK